MNEDAIKDAYDLFVNTGYNKSYDNFKKLIQSNPGARKDAYDLFVGTGYNKTQKDFDELMGIGAPVTVKKKEQVSPSQQKAQPTSSATGAMVPDGAPAPSARKRYDVKGKPAQPVAPAAPTAQLTAKDLEMMMPFRGAVQETTVIGDAPAVQENPFAQDVKRAGEILTKKSPEGDAFTAGIITEKPETKKYAKEVLAAVEGPTAPSYIERIVNGSVAAGTLADEIAKLGRNDNIDEIDFERIASLNKLIQDNAIEDEGGVVGFLKNLPNVLASSIISMSAAYEAGAAGTATGAVTGSVIPGLGTAAGAAAGYAGATSLALEYSSSLMGALRDAGVDITSEDQLKEAFSNPEKISEAKSYALKRGVPVAVFDAVSGGLAGKLFKTAAKATTKEVIKAGAKETAVQAALGGAGETTAQLIADGKLDARQIAYEMIAEPVSAIPPAAINYLGEKAKTAAEKKYVKRIETDANLKLKSDIATIVDPEIAASSKKINEYRKLKEEAVSQTAKDEYDKRIAEERDKKYSAYEKFFPVFDSLPDDKKQEAYDALDEVGKVKDEYNAAESPEEKKILGQVLAQKLNKLKTYAVQEQTTSEVPVQPGAAVSGEVAQGEPQAEPQVVTEEGQAQEDEIERRRQEELDTNTSAGYGVIASDYLFTGGRGSMLSTDYLLQALTASFPFAGKQIDAIRNKYASKLGNISDDVNSESYNDAIAEIRDAINTTYQNSEIESLYDEVLNNSTGFVPREGNRVSSRLEALNEEYQNKVNEKYDAELAALKGPEAQAQKEVAPGSKGVISGIEITYPTQEQRAEREAVRNSQDYVSARSIELSVTDTEALAEDLKGEFAMVTGENPDGQPLTEEENQALNQKAEEWLTSRGYDPKPIVGKFNQAENSFFVKGMTEADAIEFAQEFNQKSVAHSGGMLYQNGSRNPRTSGDDFSFGKFETGMDMVSIVNTTDGPRQFSVAYDFKTTIESDAVSDFDQAVNNSAQSLKLVAPDLKIIVAENTEDAQLQIAEALSAVAPSQAADVAEGFTTETRGQTVFVNGKPFAIVLDKSQADTVTIGHEVWETMLNDAFGDDQAKFKEFRDGIDRQLRLNGFEDIAKALTDFSNQRGYEDVKYSEYMAELGGMLVANGFKQGSLDAKQKSLLQKIGDVINKFAQLFTGKKQFLDQATPEDILGFMVTISEKVAKGEDVASFFRPSENTETIKDTKKVLTNRSQKIGDFDIQYFEDEAKFKDLVDRGLVIQNASIDEAAGQPVATHQPDNLLVGNVNYKGKQIMEGNGGIYYVLKFGNVWASGKQNSAKNLANYINKSRKESTDGIGRMVLVRGSQDKMISSVQGVKAAMRILEELVFDNLISTSDFRKALTSAGKAYNIDFSGSNSAKQIQKDIEGKFMNVSDSTFSDRGDFFSTLVNEIGKLDSAKKNIKEIQKALGATKNIQFSKEGIRKQIGTVLTERLLIGLDSGNAYAMVEVDEDVVVKKDDQHPSYPFSIVTKSGKPPVLKVFNYRPKAVEAITTMSGEKASNAQLGFAQRGMGMGRVASDKEIVVAEEGVQEEAGSGVGQIEAYHRSSNKFNKFKISNVSADSNKKRYGYGLYFSTIIPIEEYGENIYKVKLFKDKKEHVLIDTKKPVEKEIVNKIVKALNGDNKKSAEVVEFAYNGWLFYKAVSRALGSDKYASLFLSKNGIDGLKISQAKNFDDYVLFNDDSITIEEVNKKPQTEPKVVKSRSQKNVPPVVDEVLTDDGKGNYLFVHYSRANRDVIKPMSGSNSNFTSKEEVSAISAVGGVAMYYTKAGQKESGVGDVPHTVLVPKDKVYFYGSTEKGTVSHDPEGFEEEARQRFQAYRNRGNEDRPTKYAFDANNSAAWVTKVAAENGYDMLVTNWGGPKSYRAQTTKALKPEAEYTGFKQIPEPKYEVGDEVFLYGQYVTLTDVKPDVLSYQAESGSGKYPLTVMTRDKIIMVQKAKPTVTTKSQKIVVNTIPGYERMMGEVEGILDKTMNRTGSYNQATANAVGYIQKSSVYKRADDSQREQIIRDFVKLRGEKIKVAPSVGKIMGQIKDTKKVTVNEKTALKDQIKLEAKAAKDAVAFVKQLRMQISTTLRGMAGRGVISAKQASTILARYDRMNILNPDMRDRFVDYMANVFQSAEYADKVKEATKLRKTIRKAAKNPDNQAESSKLAKTFAEIDPSRVENIDDYLNNAEQILKSVSRKTGDVKMRSLVNMTDMVSYIDKEIQEQRKQIKNEILSKYQDLVDAGVLDSKMTINEINKVVAAIEENEDESAAKAKEAKAAVKQMMDEVSPILLQIARTGEDPFTGDPIDLTQDEKAAIVKLAKMDLDNLSLAEAVKALEYANNFIANGVTSGIVGMVDLYEGSLNAEKLAKKGFKSIPFKKYFSKGAGRIWAEQIASLPMLNKLMWGSTSRALEVSEASGVTGVSNGKAKAIKIVEKAVKEYVATFSNVKDFLSSENVVERGMLAFVSRTVIGDQFQAQDEFNRRKSLIEETIQALKDPENSTDAEIKKGEVVEKVYNKILKDAKNAKEVRANVSEVNKKAVDWWVNEWSKHYDRMDEVSRNVYNTLLSRDSNFTPDRFQLKEVSPAAEEDFDSGFFGNFENVSTEKSGSLKENKRIKNLPQNKNGVKTRIVNLDFDVNNVNALTNAIVDVETAGSVMQMKGFVTSKDFGKLFASKEDKNVYKKRLVSYVNRAKGQGYVDQSELKTLNRLVNTVASFGTAKALFSLSQPFKQSIPPLFNTLVQTGRLDLGTLMVGGFSFIDRTGYPIANRGISSQGELKSINRQLVEAEKNLLLRGVDGVAAYSNLMLELTLKYPDIITARSSWLSFYKKGLKKEGIKTSGINWNTHEVNKKAADYAQMMVDSQQNISDSDMQGEFMASKDPAKAFLRRAIFPLMTFVLNQKTRIWADVRTLSNKAVTTAEDRQEAALSLAGALVELGAFSAISYAANSMLWEVAMNILAAVSGEDDEDDREEEKKKMILRRSAYTAQNFMKDFFVPPIPGADLLASKGINYILDETNLSSEIPADWFGIEDDRVKFRLYDKENQGYLDMLGTQGIALEKALELADYYDIAIDGKFKEESYGTKREKQILEGDADMARINAAIMTGYYGGLLPADVAYIVGQINKKIKKRAEVVEEED